MIGILCIFLFTYIVNLFFCCCVENKVILNPESWPLSKVRHRIIKIHPCRFAWEVSRLPNRPCINRNCSLYFGSVIGDLGLKLSALPCSKIGVRFGPLPAVMVKDLCRNKPNPVTCRPFSQIKNYIELFIKIGFYQFQNWTISSNSSVWQLINARRTF